MDRPAAESLDASELHTLSRELTRRTLAAPCAACGVSLKEVVLPHETDASCPPWVYHVCPRGCGHVLVSGLCL